MNSQHYDYICGNYWLCCCWIPALVQYQCLTCQIWSHYPDDWILKLFFSRLEKMTWMTESLRRQYSQQFVFFIFVHFTFSRFQLSHLCDCCPALMGITWAHLSLPPLCVESPSLLWFPDVSTYCFRVLCIFFTIYLCVCVGVFFPHLLTSHHLVKLFFFYFIFKKFFLF